MRKIRAMNNALDGGEVDPEGPSSSGLDELQDEPIRGEPDLERDGGQVVGGISQEVAGAPSLESGGLDLLDHDRFVDAMQRLGFAGRSAGNESVMNE